MRIINQRTGRDETQNHPVPEKGRKMKLKKLLSIILAALMIAACLALASCGTSEEKVLNVYTNAGFAPYEYLDENGKLNAAQIPVNLDDVLVYASYASLPATGEYREGKVKSTPGGE